MDAALKNRYPFRLGTTSFIHPAGYVSNVRQLAPLLDEIELLLLESNHLPSQNDIAELGTLARAHDITYNVHLPMDIDLASDDGKTRRQSITSVAKAIDRVALLNPTTHTLHLTYTPAEISNELIEAWQNRALESMDLLLTTSGIDAGRISIETLDFSPEWLKRIVETLDLSICVDVGHVIIHGFELGEVLGMFAKQTAILHLHGVAEGRDHLAVSHLGPDARQTISNYLQNFSGSVSLEVFSPEQLAESLACFPNLMAGGMGR